VLRDMPHFARGVAMAGPAGSTKSIEAASEWVPAFAGTAHYCTISPNAVALACAGVTNRNDSVRSYRAL